MSIVSVFIKNYQNHKNTFLEFKKGLNVIIGPSDSGKSAVLRAMLWAINNKPSGNSFCRNGTDQTQVMIDIATPELFSIVRTKSKKKNSYALHKDSMGKEENLTFKGFGQNVPEDISKILNIGSVNIQEQHDPPFLLAATPGEVAKHFNSIADLEIIDIATSNIARTLKTEKNNLQFLNDEQRKYEQEFEKLNWISLVATQVEELEKVEKKMVACETMGDSIDILLTKLHDIKKENAINAPFLKAIGHIEELENLSSLATKKQNEADALYTLCENIKSIGIKLKTVKQQTTLQKKINFLSKQENKIQVVYKQSDRLEDLIDRIILTNEDWEGTLRHLKKTKEKFKKLFPNNCPLCGQEV